MDLRLSVSETLMVFLFIIETQGDMYLHQLENSKDRFF